MEEETRKKYDQKLGATGEFPQGQLDDDDKGEIAIAVSSKKGLILIDFGNEPVKWIGCRPDDARAFAALLQDHADFAEK